MAQKLVFRAAARWRVERGQNLPAAMAAKTEDTDQIR